MKQKVALLSSLLVITACKDLNSPYWNDFVSSRDANTGLRDSSSPIADEHILNDYSYAGYFSNDIPLPSATPKASNASYRVINVQDYGALPDDDISDKQAIKNAIEAIKQYRQQYHHSSTDVLYFPAGTYIINNADDDALIDPNNLDDIKNKQPIFVDLDRIILKGDGIGVTTLKMDTHLQPENPAKKWTTPHMLQVGARSSSTTVSANILLQSDVVGGSANTVTVDNVQGFQVGDSIELRSLITRSRAIEKAVSPYLIEYKASSPNVPVWANLTKGLNKREKHTIQSISGNTLTFATPIAHSLSAQDKWTVSKITSYANIGIENLTISGNWQGDFVHHKDALHDSGYSLLSLRRAHNSWIRDVELRNFNQGGVLWNTYNVTARNITLSGTPGHLAFTIMYGNNNLIDGLTDHSKAWHAPGVSKYSISNVYRNSQYGADSSIDLHGEQSMHNLFYNMTGG